MDGNPSGTVLKKQVGEIENGEKSLLNGVFVAVTVLVAFVAFLLILRRRRKN